jgi:integrase
VEVMEEMMKNISKSDIEKFRMMKQIFGNDAAGIRQVTLKEFYDEYITHAEFNLAPKSVLSIKQSFKPLLHFFSPIRPLDTIKLIDVEKFIRKIQTNSPKGFRVAVRTLKSAFNKAKQWDYISDSPFIKIKLPRVQKLREDYLSVDDVKLITDKAESELIKNVIVFAFNTGMRLSEITLLESSSVNLNKKIITVGTERYVTKSRKVRYIPMNDTVYDLLLSIKHTEKQSKKYVFGKTASMPYTTDFLSKKFKVAFKKTNIKTDYCFHSLRHGFASRLAQLGVPIITISKLLGHSSISTTMIYAEVNLDDLRQGIEKL